MLTGRVPFEGDTALSIAVKHKTEIPKDPREFNRQIPEGLSRLILKCVEKEKEKRYQRVDEILSALVTIESLTPTTGITAAKVPDTEKILETEWKKSIVVLPFTDLSPQKDQEYFCDGMTEEIIADLSHVHDLLVISRSSAMTFKGTKKKIPEIAREVNVRYVLEGSVRKAGSSLRITAQLIDGVNDAHLWAEKYSGTLDDVFDIQEKVSRSILEALKLKLTLQEDRAMAEKPIDNGAAYESYLRAKHECMLFSVDGLERALKDLQNGLDIIGDNALLYAGLGFVHVQMVNVGIGQQEHLDEARKYVEKAVLPGQ